MKVVQDRGVIVDATKCTGCLICQLRCSLRFEGAFNLAKSAIQIRRVSASDHEYEVSFTDKCDRCGICARYCPYGTLTWIKKTKSGDLRK